MATWNIHDADGRYIGQTEAADPRTAFCRYMELVTEKFDPLNVKTSPASGGSFQLVHGSTSYILTPTSTSPDAID